MKPFRRKDEMEFNSFLEQILDAVNAELPSGRTARYKAVNKTNGVVYTGMYLDAGEKGTVSPIVYMEPVFDGISGPETIPELARELARILISPVKQERSAFRVAEYEYAKERIVFRLINLAENGAMLERLPHRTFLDLAVTYGVFISDGDDGFGIAQVSHALMDQWGITEETLYELASGNSMRLMGDAVKSLTEVMGDGLPDDTEEDRRKAKEAGRFFMVTNRYSFLGAATLLYSDRYAEIAKKVGSDLYLLPTSVHEVMTVPADGRSPEEIKTLQKAIVSEDPLKEHHLTESVYYYSAADGRFSIA